MLPAAHRMRQSGDFHAAMRGGRRAGSRHVVVHATVVPDAAGPARVGFVVSKRVGSAVVRNQVKRRLREAVRARLPELPAGALVVVRANPEAARATSAIMGGDLDVLLPRVLRDRRPASPARASGTSPAEGS